MEVETCGESRKVVKSVLIFIYTPVISLSLVSKFSKPNTQRIELPYLLSLSPLPLLLFGAVFALYFVQAQLRKRTVISKFVPVLSGALSGTVWWRCARE